MEQRIKLSLSYNSLDVEKEVCIQVTAPNGQLERITIAYM